MTSELLKYGGEAVNDWMHVMFNLAWKEERVPQDCRKTTIVPVYKGKGVKNKCSSYKGISLLSIPNKVYGKIFIGRAQGITYDKVGEEKGRFKTGKGCVNEIFNMRMTTEKRLARQGVCCSVGH